MDFNYDYDTQNYRQVLQEFSQQIQKSIHLGDHVVLEKKDFDSIAIIGMGGSGIPGRLLQDYLRNEKFPIYLVQGYELPEYITQKTLVFVISYSGNTDETIDVYRKVARKQITCVAISTGGKLEQIAPMYKNHFIKIPEALQPRAATGYMFTAMLLVLVRNAVIDNKAKDIKNTITTLAKDVYESHAKDLAEKIGSKIPVIYASNNFLSVAYKWKIAINECAKRPAYMNVVPEALHNELEALNGQIFTIIIKDLNDDPRIRSRMDALKTFIRDNGQEAVEMVVRGDDDLSKRFSTMLLGDWVAYYLALAHGVDPTPIDNIESFKKRMK